MNDQADIDAYNAALDALAREKPANADEKADIDSLMGGLFRMVRRRQLAAQVSTSSHSTAVAVTTADSSNIKPEPALSTDEPEQVGRFIGMSSCERAVVVLKELREEMRMADLVQAIIDTGFEFETESPGSTLGAALDRRADKFGDVIRVDRGTWAWVGIYTEKKLKSLRHKERTRRGIERRKQSGKRIGPQPKLDEAQMEILLDMARQNRPTDEICKTFRISSKTYYNYIYKAGITKRDVIKAHKEKTQKVEPEPATGERRVLPFNPRSDDANNEKGSSTETDEPSQPNGVVGSNPT